MGWYQSPRTTRMAPVAAGELEGYSKQTSTMRHSPQVRAGVHRYRLGTAITLSC